MRTAEELRYLVLAAELEGRRQLARQLRPLGLTPSQAEVLRVLADHAPLSLNGLGSLLVCESGSSPSRLVDRVVAQGLVDRRPGPTDARAVELSLTAEGERLAREVAKIEDRMYAAIDAISGPAVQVTVDFLRAFVDGSPVGQAFARRVALSDPPRRSTRRRSRTSSAR
ncbi:MAG: MarR family transcriptional regulator [Candidatus Nanopelagicales bacterium]|nr:MarR family transcriptional regulator [Candidatus Nanopelagicales bacterium]MCF8542545.1 MarR family transcriptional regulator [Candidatus Nanopelagicales bacterium]